MEDTIQVSLEDIYLGKEVSKKVSRKVICRGCDLQPRLSRCKKCTARCANEHELQDFQVGPMIFQQMVEVPSKQKCIRRPVTLLAEVERGMFTGDRIVFPGMGEQQPQMTPGDVVLSIQVLKHNRFVRKGANLNIETSITLKEALLGFERTIEHLDGRNLTYTVEDVSRHNSIVKIKGEGMPLRKDPSIHGDLVVKVNLVMPEDDELTEEHRMWLEENFPE